MAMQIESAMLLAAGLGTRLKPLTLTTPKPLLPLDGGLLIDHQLRYLAASGIKKVAINLHHLGQMIRDHVGDGSRYKLEIVYSMEPEILGTGGGVKGAARFFGRTPFVSMNADALLAADLSAIATRHLESGADATTTTRRSASLMTALSASSAAATTSSQGCPSWGRRFSTCCPLPDREAA